MTLTNDDLLMFYYAVECRCALVPRDMKRAVDKGWPNAAPSLETCRQHLLAGGNIGLITGSAGGLIDVDLDCPEALALAPTYLPETGAIFGRTSRPASHWLYLAPGATYRAFADPISGDMLVELRAPGATGGAHMTLLPPSVADGEVRTWQDDRIAPAAVDAA